jgi:drug/metabolite transporter (DMT)-like permease
LLVNHPLDCRHEQPGDRNHETEPQARGSVGGAGPASGHDPVNHETEPQARGSVGGAGPASGHDPVNHETEPQARGSVGGAGPASGHDPVNHETEPQARGSVGGAGPASGHDPSTCDTTTAVGQDQGEGADGSRFLRRGAPLTRATATTAAAATAAPKVKETGALAEAVLQLGPGLIWGASFLFIAEGLEAVGPNGVAFLRIAIGLATLALVPAARRALPAGAWRQIALLGVVWFAVPLSLFPFAEQRVSSAVTGMLNGAVPLFAALVGVLLERRAPSRRMAAGLAVGLLGAVCVSAPSLGAGATSTVGVLLILAALVSYGFAIHIARPLQQAHGALPVICRALLVAAVLTAPLGLRDVAQARWSLWPVLALLALGALGTGLAFVLAATAAGRLGATRAAATAFVIPAVALALGVAVRGESVAPLAIVGAAVSLAGVWLLRRAQR